MDVERMNNSVLHNRNRDLHRELFVQGSKRSGNRTIFSDTPSLNRYRKQSLLKHQPAEVALENQARGCTVASCNRFTLPTVPTCFQKPNTLRFCMFSWSTSPIVRSKRNIEPKVVHWAIRFIFGKYYSKNCQTIVEIRSWTRQSFEASKEDGMLGLAIEVYRKIRECLVLKYRVQLNYVKLENSQVSFN